MRQKINTWFYMGGSGLHRNDDFQKFANQNWIGLNFIGSGLDSDWKISQSAHLCKATELFGKLHFTIRSYLVFQKSYPIRILFWLKSHYPYPKTIRKSGAYYDAQHTFLGFEYFTSWGKIASGIILSSAEHMGAIWLGTWGTCPPHFPRRGGHNMPCPPTFFS